MIRKNSKDTQQNHHTLESSEIKTSSKYINKIPRQTIDERNLMLESVMKRGIDKPLEISNLTGLLVDGFERLTVGRLAKIQKFPVMYKDFESEIEELQYVINNSLCRRNLSTWWVGKLNHLNVELQKRLAKQRQKTGKKINSKIQPHTLGQICTKVKGRSNEIATRGKNISPRTQSSVEKILKSGDAELIKKLDNHKITTHKAERIIREKEIESLPIVPLPKGKFNHIVEDPGWFFANQNIGGSGKSGASFQYLTQPTVNIAKIPVSSIAAENAILYMWSTNQHLITGSMLLADYLQIAHGMKPEQTEHLGKTKVQSDAISVMHSHGFTPKHIITWEKQNKEGWGGYSFNNVTEHLLIGTRGIVKPFGLTEKTIINTPYKRNSHSKKPDEMWNLIEKCIGTQRWKNKKIELNCRTPRKGWLPHGNQITQKDIDLWQKLK